MLQTALRWLGGRLADYLSRPGRAAPAAAPTDLTVAGPALQPGDGELNILGEAPGTYVRVKAK